MKRKHIGYAAMFLGLFCSGTAIAQGGGVFTKCAAWSAGQSWNIVYGQSSFDVCRQLARTCTGDPNVVATYYQFAHLLPAPYFSCEALPPAPLSQRFESTLSDKPSALVAQPSGASAKPEERFVAKRSGKKNSGEMDRWSQWYDLCTDPVPAGFVIVSHEFRLEGDRQCGAWAECRASYLGTDKVCYEFRMQGHNEGFLGIGNPNSGARESEGVLRATLRK